MKVKASLHLHSKEDYRDGKVINYTILELIDKAVECDFRVLALTGHEKAVCLPEHIAYAKKLGILLIPGVELDISGRHLLVLNCTSDIDKVRTFAQLEDYRRKHPECLMIAPHPHHFIKSLGLAKLKKYRHLLDAVEHSWYYLSWFNPNIKAEHLAKELKLPYIATSDLHKLEYLDRDYAVLDVKELTVLAVFEAVRQGRFVNFSQPKTVLELVIFFFKIVLKIA